MSQSLKRFFGVLLMIVAISGMLFSTAAIISLWTLNTSFTETLLKDLQIIDEAMVATDQGLVVAEEALLTSVGSVESLRTTLITTGDSIQDTSPLLDTLTTLTSEDLPTSISSAQTSLVSAQESARIIDSVLTTLTSIPFVPKDIYDPPVPLHTSLGQVHDSMNSLPEVLKEMESSLKTAKENLTTIESEMDTMVSSISAIKTSLEEAQGVLDQYQKVIEQMRTRVTGLEQRVPGQIQMLSWILTFVLVWVFFSQIGLLMQGLDILEATKSRPVQ